MSWKSKNGKWEFGVWDAACTALCIMAGPPGWLFGIAYLIVISIINLHRDPVIDEDEDEDETSGYDHSKPGW